MELQKAIRILSENRDQLAKATLNEDRVVTNPIVEATDVVLAALKERL